MNHNMSSKMRVQLLQRRGVRAVVSSLLAVCLVVSAVSSVVGNIGSRVLASGPQQVVDIAVVPSSKTVQVNGTFTLDIYVYPNGQQVDSVDAVMTFDNTYLEVQSITGDPSALDLEMKSEFDNAAGTLHHGRATFGPFPNTTFRLCFISFKAKAPTAGTTLAFTNRTDATEPTLGLSVLRDKMDGTVIILRPVGGVTYPDDPGRILAPWVGLIVLAGLTLGAAGMIFRRRMG